MIFTSGADCACCLPQPRRHAEAIDRIVRQVVESADPLRVILFGSAARGEMHRDSDVDLLVVVPDGASCKEVMDRLYLNVSGGGVPYDFLVASPEGLERHRDNPGLVDKAILSEGREGHARETSPAR